MRLPKDPETFDRLDRIYMRLLLTGQWIGLLGEDDSYRVLDGGTLGALALILVAQNRLDYHTARPV